MSVNDLVVVRPESRMARCWECLKGMEKAPNATRVRIIARLSEQVQSLSLQLPHVY